MTGSSLDCRAGTSFYFLDSLVLHNWMWLYVHLCLQACRIYFCLHSCMGFLMSADALHLLFCLWHVCCPLCPPQRWCPGCKFHLGCPAPPRTLPFLKTPLPWEDSKCHRYLPQGWVQGLSAATQWVGAYVCGFTLEWRLSIIHTHLPPFTPHSHPQPVSQSETFSRKLHRSI